MVILHGQRQAVRCANRRIAEAAKDTGGRMVEGEGERKDFVDVELEHRARIWFRARSRPTPRTGSRNFYKFVL